MSGFFNKKISFPLAILVLIIFCSMMGMIIFKELYKVMEIQTKMIELED